MHEDYFALFAYGSLLNLRSFELTIGRRYLTKPQTCVVRGWRRAWDTAMPNEGFFEDVLDGPMFPELIMYMNVRDSVNGVVYFVTDEELRAFDRREWTYDRISIDWAATDSDSACGTAYMYVAKPEWHLLPGKPKTGAAIRKTYLEIIATGVTSLGPAFEMKYNDSTDPVLPELVFDDRFSGNSDTSFAQDEGT